MVAEGHAPVVAVLSQTAKRQMPSSPHPKEPPSRTVEAFGLQIGDF
jgi:hypothetical protein